MADPDDIPEGKSFRDFLNPKSLEVLAGWVEASLVTAEAGMRYQFERQGYFVADAVDSTPGRLVFNRIIELRDSWAKITQQATAEAVQGREESIAPPAAIGNDENENRHTKVDIRNQLRAANPELAQRLLRYTEELDLSFEDADILTGDLELAHFFEAVLAAHANPRTVANWVTNEVLREAKDGSLSSLSFNGAALGELVALVDNGTISATIGKEVFAEMAQHGGSPSEIVRRRNLSQITDPAQLEPLIATVIEANPVKAEEYRSGKIGLLGFFVGQVMRLTHGKANPQLVNDMVRKQLA